jgi:hypothetical protein
MAGVRNIIVIDVCARSTAPLWRRHGALVSPTPERLVADSPLEEKGFELPVPFVKRVGLSGGTGGAPEAKRAVPSASFILRGD